MLTTSISWISTLAIISNNTPDVELRLWTAIEGNEFYNDNHIDLFIPRYLIETSNSKFQSGMKAKSLMQRHLNNLLPSFQVLIDRLPRTKEIPKIFKTIQNGSSLSSTNKYQIFHPYKTSHLNPTSDILRPHISTCHASNCTRPAVIPLLCLNDTTSKVESDNRRTVSNDT